MKERRESDTGGIRTGEMQDRRDAGQEICRTGGIRTGEIQDWRDQDRRDAGQE